jgi:hypothetical protein
MIPPPRWREDALTGLELVILLVVIIGATGLLLLSFGGGPTPGWIRTFSGGMVAESMYMSGDSLQPVGSMTGFSAASGTMGGIPVRYSRTDPGRLGSVRQTLSLFIGDTGGIDMDQLNVSWSTAGSVEYIPKSDILPLVCPNWTITAKYNMLPGRTADSDNWLEPGEQFQIHVCPSQTVAAYQSFTLTLHPDGVAIPLPITRMAPMRIQPVMVLG